jgi:hypothetical protein
MALQWIRYRYFAGIDAGKEVKKPTPEFKRGLFDN